MRILIYIPILHISADFGEIASEFEKKGKTSFGEENWKKHKEAILKFWESVAYYFDSLDAKNLKIYQDGLIAGEEIGLKIITKGAQKGSKNFKIVSRLISQGAQLVKTEDFSLAKKEYDYIIKITKAEKITKKIIAVLNYMIHKKSLLNRRDKFIAKTINNTLGKNETGVLFLGAQHEIISKLSEDIEIIEIKNREKIKEYQKRFVSKKNKEKLNQLADYLISPVK